MLVFLVLYLSQCGYRCFSFKISWTPIWDSVTQPEATCQDASDWDAGRLCCIWSWLEAWLGHCSCDEHEPVQLMFVSIDITSRQCYGSCTGCQFVSESRSRSPGSCINRSLVLLPRILLMTVIFCLMLVVVHWGDIRKLLVPWTHNKLGDRSFSAASPRLWNDLPPGLRQPGLSFDSFRRSLKTHLFDVWSA